MELKNLPGLSEDAKKELDTIVQNKGITMAERSAQLREWAKKQGDAAVQKIDELKKKMDIFVANVQNVMKGDSISAEVKKAMEEMNAVHDDKTLTIQQEMDKIKAIRDKLSDKCRNELDEVYKKAMAARKKRDSAAQNSQIMIPPPPGASEEGAKTFTAIINDEKLTISQITEKLLEWSMKESPDVQEKIKVLCDDIKNAGKLIREQATTATLSDKAKEALTKLATIFDDLNVTPMKEAEEINAVLSALPADVKTEIDQFTAEKMDKRFTGKTDIWYNAH